MLTEGLGWVATALFVSSYFLKSPLALRVLQMCGAALWIVYGALIHAVPVIAANALVLGAAAWSSLPSKSNRGRAARPQEITQRPSTQT